MTLFALLALLLSSLVTASDNSTEQFQGWKAEPDSDSGTASVVWQCLTTIGLCTYVVVHVNITPTPLGGFSSFLRKCIVVLIGVIFPEVWAWGTVSQLLEARKLVKESERIGHKISLKQGFFVYSGGITIRDLHQAVPSMEAKDMFGKDVFVNSRSVWFRDWRKKLSDKEIVMFATRIPPDEEIDDKSKQDTLVKIVTSLQAFWFVVQLAARAQQGLVVAPMQIGTLAYVSMAAFTHGCWWQKAYDINVPRVLDGKSEVTIRDSDVDSKTWVAAEDHEKFKKMLTTSRVKFLRHIGQAFHDAVKATTYDVYSIIVVGSNHIMIMGGLTSIFTSIHYGAWNYAFPTPTETLLWRILTCGGILVGPWAFIETSRLSSGVWWRAKGKWGPLGYIVYEVFWGLFSFLYLLSRLYVMVESFLAFRQAPSSVYEQVDWNAYVPHFGA